MQTALTVVQARQITRGRTPLVPIQYEEAVRALEACITLDESKVWADKSDALAAWAKIYRDGKVLRQAKILKLKSFRRMGELARELNPRVSTKGVGGRGSLKGTGHLAALKRHGLSHVQADSASILSKMSERNFERLLKDEHIRAPATYRSMRRDEFSTWSPVQRALMCVRSRTRAISAREIKLSDFEIEPTRALIAEIMDWLDELDQRLPKARKAA